MDHSTYIIIEYGKLNMKECSLLEFQIVLTQSTTMKHKKPAMI